MKKYIAWLLLFNFIILSFASCSDESGYKIHWANKENAQEEIFSFVKSNQGLLEDIATRMTNNKIATTLSYDCYVVDPATDRMGYQLTETYQHNGNTEHKKSDDSLYLELVELEFIGLVVYNPLWSSDVIAFEPNLSGENEYHYFVYCMNAGATNTLTELYDTSTTHITQIVEQWYYIRTN